MYYEAHQYVESCRIEATEREGALIIVLSVKFTSDVTGYSSFGDSHDKIDFIEQLAMHLKEYEESSDSADRMII